MFEAFGYRVKQLLRVRVGNLGIGHLPCGHWRALTQWELKELQSKDRSNKASGRVDRGKKATGSLRKSSRTFSIKH
jgi:hypothetical protein